MSVGKLVILLPIAPSRRLEKRKKGGRTRLKRMIRSLTRSIKVKLTLAVNGIRMIVVPIKVIVMKRRPTLLLKQVLHLHQDSSPTLCTMTNTPTCLMEKEKVQSNSSLPTSSDDGNSDSETDPQLEENMIKIFGKIGYTKIKSLVKKIEK